MYAEVTDITTLIAALLEYNLTDKHRVSIVHQYRLIPMKIRSILVSYIKNYYNGIAYKHQPDTREFITRIRVLYSVVII